MARGVKNVRLILKAQHNPDGVALPAQRVANLFCRLNGLDTDFLSARSKKPEFMRMRRALIAVLLTWTAADVHEIGHVINRSAGTLTDMSKDLDLFVLEYDASTGIMSEAKRCMGSKNPWRMGRKLVRAKRNPFEEKKKQDRMNVPELTAKRRDLHRRTVRFASALYKAHGDRAQYPTYDVPDEPRITLGMIQGSVYPIELTTS